MLVAIAFAVTEAWAYLNFRQAGGLSLRDSFAKVTPTEILNLVLMVFAQKISALIQAPQLDRVGPFVL